MAETNIFADVVDATDRLSLDEQQTLLEILHRRVAERGRQRLIQEVQEARVEQAQKKCRPATVDEIMKEILS